MIYIFTALYCEAHLFIRHFNLMKRQESTWFQLFFNETAGIRLTVTGVGEVAAAAVVGSVCSVYKPTQNDVLLNIGICAHTTKKDGIFLCNKIVEKATGRTFYPDMLYRHSFTEATLVTGMQIYRSNDDAAQMPADSFVGGLYDMEAAAVYQTGIHFFGPHQMMFLKIVSDRGVVEKVKEQTALLMEKYKDDILDFIGQLSIITQKNECRKNRLCREEETLIETFCTDLHCSKAMKDSMKQHIQYLTLAEIDFISVIQDMYEKKQLPCRDKKEGKQRFEEFKRRLF